MSVERPRTIWLSFREVSQPEGMTRKDQSGGGGLGGTKTGADGGSAARAAPVMAGQKASSESSRGIQRRPMIPILSSPVRRPSSPSSILASLVRAWLIKGKQGMS
jgi:hypothetical protein